MRVKITLAYDGTDFYGSQVQKSNHPTILGELTHVLSILNINAKPIASGRTDKGVHAFGQVCHIDLPPYWQEIHKLQQTLNTLLPKSIHVKKIQKVSKDFHARFSAKKRIYRYIIKRSPSNPFEARFVTFLPTLDFDSLANNIQLFQGTHDFYHFHKTGSEVASTTRTIFTTSAYKHKEYIILFFEADGFLRAQIRLMVGALLQLQPLQIQEMLTKKRYHKIKPAPPQGLYLAKIKY
jgi:tRNA pseudouridine38-40 synthase